MKREFLLNVVFLLLVSLLIKPLFVFGIDMQVQNQVGDKAYGLYFALFGFSYLFQIINDLGIQYFNNNLVSRHPQLAAKYLPHILLLKTALAVGCLLLTFGCALLVGYRGEALHLLLFLTINQILLSLLFYLRSNLSGLGWYRLDSIVSVSDRLLMIGLVGFLLYFRTTNTAFQIEWLAYCQTLSYLLTAGFAAALLLYRTIPLKTLHWRIHYPTWLAMLKHSYPYAIVVFLMSIYIRVDGILIERLLPEKVGDEEAGIFAHAYRLLDALNTIGLLFAGLLMPMFARLLKSRGDFSALVTFSHRLIMSASLALSIGICAYRQEVMQALHPGASEYMGDVLGVLIFAFNASSTIYIYGTLLTANQSLRQMNRLFVVGVLANILFNSLLILEYRALGSAIATTITQLTVAAANIFLAVRLVGVRIPLSYWLRMGSYVLLVTLLFWWQPSFHSNWTVSFIGSLGICAVLAFALRMVDISELRAMLKSTEL